MRVLFCAVLFSGVLWCVRKSVCVLVQRLVYLPKHLPSIHPSWYMCGVYHHHHRRDKSQVVGLACYQGELTQPPSWRAISECEIKSTSDRLVRGWCNRWIDWSCDQIWQQNRKSERGWNTHVTWQCQTRKQNERVQCCALKATKQVQLLCCLQSWNKRAENGFIRGLFILQTVSARNEKHHFEIIRLTCCRWWWWWRWRVLFCIQTSLTTVLICFFYVFGFLRDRHDEERPMTMRTMMIGVHANGVEEWIQTMSGEWGEASIEFILN